MSRQCDLSGTQGPPFIQPTLCVYFSGPLTGGKADQWLTSSVNSLQ